MISWSDLPREETTTKRLTQRVLDNGTEVINLDYGINLYRGAISKTQCDNIINSTEAAIALGIPGIVWSGAQVNDKEEQGAVRNCLDLKYKREDLEKNGNYNKELFNNHEVVDRALDVCLNDYEQLWHLKMNYKEAFNFVKYLPGKYFKIHGDHGPYYACTVSAVVYLNDNYEGGEIEFVRQGLVIKPEAGDIVVFPSNFVYEHASLEVFSGTKYSVVIMTDYNDMHHKGVGNEYR